MPRTGRRIPRSGTWMHARAYVRSPDLVVEKLTENNGSQNRAHLPAVLCNGGAVRRHRKCLVDNRGSVADGFYEFRAGGWLGHDVIPVTGSLNFTVPGAAGAGCFPAAVPFRRGAVSAPTRTGLCARH